MEKQLIDIQKLTTGYDTHEILSGVNLGIYSSDFIGVIGPNGGGKTTLLKALLGEIKPWNGKIDFHIPYSKVGYLPQINAFDKVFPITVIEVVLSGLAGVKGLLGRYKPQDVERANALLDKAGVYDFRHKAVGNLSGGQVQRTLLCRALINNPELLILDEPGNFVDNKFEHELFKWLVELNQNMAILMVSHDLGTISAHVKTIACVNRTLHYHQSNKISEEQLTGYNCPIQLITHGEVPHRVLRKH